MKTSSFLLHLALVLLGFSVVQYCFSAVIGDDRPFAFWVSMSIGIYTAVLISCFIDWVNGRDR